MRTKRSQEIIRKIAEEEGLTIKQVNDIVNSFFLFVKKMMNESDKLKLDFIDVRLLKFGLFKVSESKRRRTEMINKLPNKRNEKSTRNRRGDVNSISRVPIDKGVQSNLESGPFD